MNGQILSFIQSKLKIPKAYISKDQNKAKEKQEENIYSGTILEGQNHQRIETPINEYSKVEEIVRSSTPRAHTKIYPD